MKYELFFFLCSIYWFQIFINVPWYFSMLYSIYCPFLTQRTKSKFVISKEGNATETLYKYVSNTSIIVYAILDNLCSLLS